MGNMTLVFGRDYRASVQHICFLGICHDVAARPELRIEGLVVITANRLRDGAVIY